jgi:centromeric protein E
MKGYHGSVFSYGQTSSGKTFTMNGGGDQTGLIEQAIRHLFSELGSHPDREFLLRVSYLEIYNEQIKDLISTDSSADQKKGIKIFQDPKLGSVIKGVREQTVRNPEEALKLIQLGEKQR